MATKRKSVRRNRPRDITTKEGLIKYLEANQDTELPFVEEAWEAALKQYEEKKDVETTVNKIVKDEDGNPVISSFNVNYNKNPVSNYFKLMGLKAYKAKAKKIQQNKILMTDRRAEIENVYFNENDDDIDDEDDDDEEENSYSFKKNDSIICWIESFASDYEKKYIKNRYITYMSEYEINEGVGKTALKGILSIELALDRIDRLRSQGEDVDYKMEKELRKSLLDSFDAMKWQPKQRNMQEEMAANKFTVMMDRMVKEGGFKPPEQKIEKDEIDKLMDIITESREKQE